MKVKDLLEYNKEANIYLIGLDYSMIDLDFLGFDKNEEVNDYEEKKKLSKNIYIIPAGLKDKYKSNKDNCCEK